MSDLSIPETMTRAWQIGYAAGIRGWATLDDLKLQAVTLPGVADAYRMGVEAGKKDQQQEGSGE